MKERFASQLYNCFSQLGSHSILLHLKLRYVEGSFSTIGPSILNSYATSSNLNFLLGCQSFLLMFRLRFSLFWRPLLMLSFQVCCLWQGRTDLNLGILFLGCQRGYVCPYNFDYWPVVDEILSSKKQNLPKYIKGISSGHLSKSTTLTGRGFNFCWLTNQSNLQIKSCVGAHHRKA